MRGLLDSVQGLLPTGIALLVAAAALGQGHPLNVSRGRPLQERLTQADVIAVVEVAGFPPGRIDVTTREALLGELPAHFAIKRSRSTPPPLAVGDRALVPLRGARPPYVLVDQPAETIRLTDATAETRWADAVRGTLREQENPDALADLMLGWVDQGPAALRDTAFASLLPLLRASPALLERVALDRAKAATAEEGTRDARAVSAMLARMSPAGLDRLIQGLAGGSPLEETGLSVALRAGALANHAELPRLFARAVRAENAELRRAAVRNPSVIAVLGASGEAQLRQLAEEDPDEAVRRAANETLGRLHRARR
ncbi:MAG: hypothetical protein CL910_03970 [Deltaproteobacteria bacterium]|jgi:hypothetical protein|nr:hypothetical protein [Deltaproteobacteria bacterium]